MERGEGTRFGVSRSANYQVSKGSPVDKKHTLMWYVFFHENVSLFVW